MLFPALPPQAISSLEQSIRRQYRATQMRFWSRSMLSMLKVSVSGPTTEIMSAGGPPNTLSSSGGSQRTKRLRWEKASVRGAA